MQVDNLNKMIYIHIPRTGGSAFTYSWPSHSEDQLRKPFFADGRFIWNNETKQKVPCGRHGTYFGTIEKFKQINGNISNYKFITIVRDPIDRIFSTYRYFKMVKKGIMSDAWQSIHDMLDLIEQAPIGKVHWFPQTHWLIENNQAVPYNHIYRFEDIIKNVNLVKKDFPNYSADKVISRQGNYDYKNNYKTETKAVARIKEIYKVEHKYMTKWYTDL